MEENKVTFETQTEEIVKDSTSVEENEVVEEGVKEPGESLTDEVKDVLVEETTEESEVVEGEE